MGILGVNRNNGCFKGSSVPVNLTHSYVKGICGHLPIRHYAITVTAKRRDSNRWRQGTSKLRSKNEQSGSRLALKPQIDKEEKGAAQEVVSKPGSKETRVELT